MSEDQHNHESENRAAFDEALTASITSAERHARGEWTPEERAELHTRLTSLQAPADVCPIWCRHDELDDDGMRVHEAVLGFAGPLEVSLRRSVPGDGAPVDELQLYDVGGRSTSQSELTMPLDPAALDALAELVREAAVSARR